MYLNLTDDGIPGVPNTEVRRRSIPTKDFEEGGPELGSSILIGYTWVCEYQNPNIVVYRQDTPEELNQIANVPNVSRVAFAFDQLMRPVVVWVAGTSVFLNWFDPVEGGQVTTELGLSATIVSPCVTLDEHRPEFVSDSDVHILYISGGDLCARTQRDRFQTEYVLRADAATQLIYVSPTDKLRVQISAI